MNTAMKQQNRVVEIRCSKCKRMLCKVTEFGSGDVCIEFKCNTCKRIITLCHLEKMVIPEQENKRIYI